MRRRFWIMLLAVSVALVIALPAGAAKPPKPPKPTTSAPVAVYLDAGPVWVHEAGDDIWYNLTVQNKTRAEVTVYVEDYDENPVTIAPKAVAEFPDLISYEVTAADIGAPVDIVGEVEVAYDGGVIVAATSTEVHPVDPCVLDELIGGEVCIWKPGATGEWTLKVTPDDLPKRPTSLMVTMRDGVPGNWCTLLEGGGGVVQDRWLRGRTEADPVTLDVYLPGSGDLALPGLDDGQCYSGGAGGDYFAVGNPESFYLYTSFDGFATAGPTTSNR